MSDAETQALLPHTNKWSFLRQAFVELDWQKLEGILQDVAEGRANKVKYFEVEKWLVRSWTQAAYLDLHRLPPQRILDLGTGPGYFPYACRVLGHNAWALDKPGTPLYDVMCEWIGVDVVPHTITAKVPLPAFSTRFDLITAIRIGFNSKGRRGNRVLFDLDDWGFFLDDLRDNLLQPGGRVLLKMIEQDDFTGLKFGDQPLLDYFASRGATFEHSKRFVLFDTLR